MWASVLAQRGREILEFRLLLLCRFQALSVLRLEALCRIFKTCQEPGVRFQSNNACFNITYTALSAQS
jgi:hypothetical protein